MTRGSARFRGCFGDDHPRGAELVDDHAERGREEGLDEWLHGVAAGTPASVSTCPVALDVGGGVRDLHPLHRTERLGHRVVGTHEQRAVLERQRGVDDGVLLVVGDAGLSACTHAHHEGLAAEDLAVAGERRRAVAAEEQIRVEGGHGRPPDRARRERSVPAWDNVPRGRRSHSEPSSRRGTARYRWGRRQVVRP